MLPLSSLFSRSICRQLLSLLLILAVGVQGLPVHTFVQHIQSPHTHHECSHSKGYCPTNPDGPCQCDHNSIDPPGEPTFQPCSDHSSTTALIASSPKWRPLSTEQIPVPHAHPLDYSSTPVTRSSQRMGDDVFHPPRAQAHVRPGSTLQALSFA